MGSKPAGVRLFRNSASKGLAPMVSEPASHRGCRTKELFFMGSKGDGKHFVGPGFAWHGLESCWRPFLYLFTGFRSSKGSGKHFVGLRFAWHGLAATGVFQGHLPRWCRSDEGSGWCRSDRRFPKAICRDDVGATSDLAISGQRDCFLWIPKVTWSSFSVCVFAWRGPESCCCSTPSQAFSQGHLPRWCRSDERSGYLPRENCYVLESCCCSSVSQLRLKGLVL